MQILHQHQQSQKHEGSPKCAIWDRLVWRRLTGTRNINYHPFFSIPSALAFSIYVDWFNSMEIKPLAQHWSYHANLPLSERLKPENVYVSRLIPGPKEPTALQLNYLLKPLIKELKKLWQGYHSSPTSMGP
ncbi:hypothetical protein O181_079298 [Austropuccinia psidii MF-1]|uniref:Uncharacterized protein n=1 Tax=Austropuccinia psidii MF-1 TaxID=1389203 RepID=A0A9Q3FGF1_9BASI|nr:hypothetical protein [Austropuccinia psidii MF-1]